jgi:hypothetical protein
VYYNARTLDDPFVIGVRVTKFDGDLNPISFYNVTAKSCTCPVGTARSCKHRDKFPTFQSIADTGKFWDEEFNRVVTLGDIQCA